MSKINVVQDILLAEEIGAGLETDFTMISTGATTDLPSFEVTLDKVQYSVNIQLVPQNGGTAGTLSAPSFLQTLLTELALTAELVTEIEAEITTESQITLPVFYATLEGHKFAITITLTPKSVPEVTALSSPPAA